MSSHANASEINGTYAPIGYNDGCRDRVRILMDAEEDIIDMTAYSTLKKWQPCSTPQSYTADSASIRLKKSSDNTYTFYDGIAEENYGCTTTLTMFTNGPISIKYCVKRTGLGAKKNHAQVIFRKYSKI